MTKWPLSQEKDEEQNDVTSVDNGDNKENEKKKLMLDVDEGETFVRNFNTSPDSDEEEWDGHHFFEDPDNPKRERSIEARIFYQTEKFKYSMR